MDDELVMVLEGLLELNEGMRNAVRLTIEGNKLEALQQLDQLSGYSQKALQRVMALRSKS